MAGDTIALRMFIDGPDFPATGRKIIVLDAAAPGYPGLLERSSNTRMVARRQPRMEYAETPNVPPLQID